MNTKHIPPFLHILRDAEHDAMAVVAAIVVAVVVVVVVDVWAIGVFSQNSP